MKRSAGGRRNIQVRGAASISSKLLFGLTPAQKKRILQAAERRHVTANQVILRTGDPATSLFLLTHGRAKYYRVTKKGEEVPLLWLAPGDAFGIGTLLAMPLRYIATAQAVEDCELLVWSRNVIRSLAATNELLAQNALQIAMDCLAVYTDRLVEVSTGTAEERLAYTLLQLGEQLGRVRPRGVELAIMNEDLASMANVSAFTASRQLKQWERQGILKKDRGKVCILSPEGLVID